MAEKKYKRNIAASLTEAQEFLDELKKRQKAGKRLNAHLVGLEDIVLDLRDAVDEAEDCWP